VSFLNVETVPVVDLLTRFVNLVFHPDVSLATGSQVVALQERLVASDLPYVLVVEGAIPTAMPHACLMAERPIVEWVEALARRASACIAAGTCAALGGVTRMRGMETGCSTLPELLRARGIKTPVVALPNCPMKPEHFVYVVLHLARLGTLPSLDSRHRPLQFFARTIHERCVHYADFQEERFAAAIGDDGCLLHLGCQGPVTRNDCPVLGHNGNVNSCIRSGHPCVGCAGVHFPRQIIVRTARDERWIEPRELRDEDI
jgi:hydrogenase small subunit